MISSSLVKQACRFKGISSIAILGVLFTSLFPLSATAQTVITIESEPGHWVGDAVSGTYTNSASGSIAVSTNYNDPTKGIQFSYDSNVGNDYVSLRFDAGQGQLLQVGDYFGATRFPFNDDTPGIDISGNGRGCNKEYGNFTVTDVTYNPDGSFASFAASFEHYCKETAIGPRLSGTVTYNATPPTHCSSLDEDYDGVINAADTCPETEEFVVDVDQHGCSKEQFCNLKSSPQICKFADWQDNFVYPGNGSQPKDCKWVGSSKSCVAKE